ncbi:isopeptide-forming domain-containing fimbrial protein [Novosphingobium sp.]|uniref:isopeptide-forming domain-containing fimbrial protein n=1 Tax=Novosphingobium sp. TaxID=1874826 RepID=UPI0026322E51|nr:isopeptide-forming domain-containing fimbrial protein [Novosphingobium sp.]
MSALRNRIWATAALLFAALLIATSVPAAAKTITNTAHARWNQGDAELTADSNVVSFDVVKDNPKISVLPLPGGGDTFTINSGHCGTDTLPDVKVDVAGANPGDPVTISSIIVGQPVVFRLVLDRASLNPAQLDTVKVTITSASGDREQVTISETAADSGVFYGAIPTSAIPPQPRDGDCRLSISGGDKVTVSYNGASGDGSVIKTDVDVLADPYGLVFDSEDAAPIDGARVTLVDVATGQPARVFADDGVTSWPSTIVTGSVITDGAGRTWQMPEGEYRFPLAPLGTYRLVVVPPEPYTAPSSLTPKNFAGLRRPDGGDLVILPASYGESLALSSPAPVRVDIPVDRPPVAVSLSKVASRQIAQPGDAVFYTITVRNTDKGRAKRGVVLSDTPSANLRLRVATIRIDGAKAATDAVTVAPDGRTMTIAIGTIAPGATRTVTYAMTVRSEASAGNALNRIDVVDARGLTATASAAVRIERDNLAATMTLIGRISLGSCDVPNTRSAPRPGIGGVRLVLEDGSFAVTDAEGRYHFEALMPGTHVVEAQAVTLPKGGKFVDCTRSTRSAGSASSRFVIGQGGSLVVANFAATVPAETLAAAAAAAAAKPIAESDRTAAGGDTDWIAKGDGPNEFVFPTADYNPRAPTTRVVIRHRKGQTVALKIDGKPVDKLAFDGAQSSPEGFAMSVWRGLPLPGEDTRFDAEVRDASGKVVETLTRIVHFGATPAKVELVLERTHLVADGATRPVVAVRVLDRTGRPVHAGISGPIALSAPYESAAALDAMQSRVLSGLDRAPPTWIVKGDDGVALIELAPTMVSGSLDLTFQFTDREVKRKQVLETWVVPGEAKWTLVGLAEGAVGAKTIADHMQRSGKFDSDLGNHARVAFYAKGRIKGKWLATVAYDSAKQRAEQRLLGGLDPRAYYTVFADGSDRRFDAASVNKLYVRIESAKVRAMFGDFDTGFDHTQLGRYQRTMTGVKAEARFGKMRTEAYAAKVATTHRRDQIPGGGISGPYRLSSRAIVPNSETVTIEVRDRFRSEVVVSSQVMTRFLDYDIDLLAGTITFKQPVLSRDANLNPQQIVVDYEIDTLNGGAWNAGARTEWRNKSEKVRLGATAISDASANTGAAVMRTNLGAVDAKVFIGTKTEVRAEAAMSHATGGSTKAAWLIEAERHDARLDVLAYIRSLDANFGVGQVSIGELGRRKIGVDTRYRLTQKWLVSMAAWRDQSLIDGSHRSAIQLGTTWNSAGTEMRLGVARYSETLAEGAAAGPTGAKGGSTTLIEAGSTKRLFDNKLELNAAGSISIGSRDATSYQAPRYRIGVRYAITPDVRLISDYEIGAGSQGETRTLRGGLEVQPWTGAKIATVIGQQATKGLAATGEQQAITEQGRRAFAAYGLAQSLPISKALTLDATIDGNKVIGGKSALATNGGTAVVGASNQTTIAEDFTAYTLGATWRSGRWSATARAELRDGELSKRKGLTFGMIRQMGEGSVVGGAVTFSTMRDASGATSEVGSAAISIAHRPATSAFAFLSKFEFRSDRISGVTAANGNGTGAATDGTALTVDGNARSRRIVASFSGDWAPNGRVDGQMVQRTELSVFVAARHNLDRYQGFDLAGTTVLGGVDARIGIGKRIEVGGSATVRRSLSDGTTSYAIGPQIGIVPADNVMVVIGYNLTGFRDRDFAAARNTSKGLFATMRVKFDSNSLAALGIGR